MGDPIIPINTAEAMLAPFYEPLTNVLRTWTVTLDDTADASCTSTWGNVNVRWNRAMPGPVVNLRKTFNLPCNDYDRLIVGAQLSQNTEIRICGETDRGVREVVYRARAYRMEYLLELGPIERLVSVNISLAAPEPGLGTAQISWIMLQSSSRLVDYERRWEVCGNDWSWHLNLELTDLSFLPRHGIICSRDQIRSIQAMAAFRDTAAPLCVLAEHAMAVRPESWIAETINLGFDLRFARDRDGSKFLVGHGDAEARRGDQVGQLTSYAGHLALVAAARRDIGMARHAARFVASILMCPHWHQSFQCVVPGLAWDHRSYLQSLIAFNVVLVADLFSELFTDLAHEVILRRLAVDVIGQTNWTMYKWDYIFSNNSLHLFTVGRMAAAAHLAQSLPRAAVEIDKAYDHAAANLDRLILHDGGYDEGPGYLNEMLRAYLMAMQIYARAKHRPFAECLHPNVFKSNDYVEAVMSTDASRYFLPLCDGARTDQDIFDHFGLMATLMPESVWTHLYRKFRAQTRGLPTEVFDVVCAPDPETFPPYQPKSFIALPHTGYVSSLRRFGDACVKVFIMGSKPDAGHVHDDIGSFIVEYAGDTFALDAGMSNYSHPDAALLKMSRYHNMLVPDGAIERDARGVSERPASIAQGAGDAVFFRACIRPRVRHAAFCHWTRRWVSPTPDILHIVDAYALNRGAGVEFLWNTQLPVQADGHAILITGTRACIRLEAPAGCPVTIRQLPHYTGRPINQIAIRKPAPHGTMRVTATLRSL